MFIHTNWLKIKTDAFQLEKPPKWEMVTNKWEYTEQSLALLFIYFFLEKLNVYISKGRNKLQLNCPSLLLI